MAGWRAVVMNYFVPFTYIRQYITSTVITAVLRMKG